MTEFTPARLAKLRAVAEAATAGPWESDVVLDDEGFAERVSVGAGTWIEPGGVNYRSTDLIFETDTYGWDEDDCQQAIDNARHVRTFDPPMVLALIAALEAKTSEVGYLRDALVELAPSAAIVPTVEVVIDGEVFTWDGLPDVLRRTREPLTEAQRQESSDLSNIAIEWKGCALEAETALDRIMALHAEVRLSKDMTACAHCYGPHDQSVEYPCPTIRALKEGEANDSEG